MASKSNNQSSSEAQSTQHEPARDDEARVSSIVGSEQTAHRPGFLPIKTNMFDRVFIGVVCFIAIHLLWMRFVEFYIPLLGATVISLILAVVIIRWG